MNEQKIIEARLMLCHYLASVAKDKGISTYRLAEMTGFKQPNVHRMLAGRYSPSLDNLIKLANALGVYLFIIDKDADSDLVTIMKERWSRPADQS